MFEHIVVPLDGTAFAESALAPARDLARAFGARIVLVRAVRPSGLPAVSAPERQAALERLDDADAYLHGVCGDLRGAGLEASVALYVAEPGTAVAEVAEVSHADLIIMAAHPRWRADLLDDAGTTLRVLARTRVALLAWRAWPAAPAGGRGPDGHERAFLGRAESPILVPLDGSAFAEGALPVAEALARRFGTYLLLLRAVEGLGEVPAVEDTELDRAAHAAAAYLERVRADLERRGVGAAVVMRRGTPVGAIDRAWRERDAGLVVMASHGISGPGRGFFGSVAAHAIEDLDAPILVVRPAAVLDAAPAGA
jgi:nucleotide-binding universal stress UspA family protein